VQIVLATSLSLRLFWIFNDQHGWIQFSFCSVAAVLMDVRDVECADDGESFARNVRVIAAA
jgi:hypothetical protein